MKRPVGLIAVLLGLAVACSGQPQAPTPLTQTPTAASPAPLPPSAPTGTHDLTLSVGSQCDVLPETERTHTYSATIDSVPQNAYGGDIVTLRGSRFLSGTICTSGSGPLALTGCNQFFASEDAAAGTVSFHLVNNNDESHGGHIVEQTAAATWLEIIGEASGTGSLTAPSIAASGTASVWYCSTGLPYPFPCAASRGCSTDLHLALTRR